MKKVFIFAMALFMVSCTTDACMGEGTRQETEIVYSDDYRVMYAFVDECVSYEDLFEGISLPPNPTLDELMAISKDIICSDVFADTIGEGDCEQVYKTMYYYYKVHYPDDEFTWFLEFIIEHEMY